MHAISVYYILQPFSWPACFNWRGNWRSLKLIFTVRRTTYQVYRDVTCAELKCRQSFSNVSKAIRVLPTLLNELQFFGLGSMESASSKLKEKLQILQYICYFGCWCIFLDSILIVHYIYVRIFYHDFYRKRLSVWDEFCLRLYLCCVEFNSSQTTCIGKHVPKMSLSFYFLFILCS